MDLVRFKELLESNEKDFIDFKREMYFSNTNKNKNKVRAEFVKDIVSMWNTPRERDAFILLGVGSNDSGENELTGLNDIIDDAALREQFVSLVSYTPKFSFDIINYLGKKFAVITVPVATIKSIIVRDFPSGNLGETLKRDTLYYREGSSNTEAVKGSNKEKEIYNWFSNVEQDINSSAYTSNEILLSEMEGFDSEKYFYFLITSPLSEYTEKCELKNFGLVNWTLVIDFDPESQDSGLLSKCRDSLEVRQSLNIVVKGNTPSIYNNYGTYWYFASGLSGRNETLLEDKSRNSWLRSYKKDFERQIESVSKSLGNKKPIKILVLVEDNYVSDYLSSVYDSLISTFEGSLSFLMLSSQSYESLNNIANERDISFLQMPLAHLCQIYNDCQAPSISNSESYSIPSSSGTPIQIEKKKLPYLKEELEIVDLSIRDDIAKDITNKGFLRGQEVSWGNLNYRHDADRDETVKLEKLVSESLRNRKHLRINLYHVPGSGGTTIARRIMWNMHTQYPCAILTTMKSSIETMERLTYLVDISQTSILLLIDNSVISSRQADDLYEKLSSSHLPIVMLQAIRKFDLPKINQSLNTRILTDKLSKNEKSRFYQLLSPEVINTKKHDWLNNELENENCSPFSLGFTVYGDDYRGVSKYIKYRLEDISDKHKEIIVYLSIAYYYGQRSIPPQWFSSLLDIPSTRHINLSDVFLNSNISDLIVYDDFGNWRISHVVFAAKSLSYLLAPDYFENERYSHVWKQNLSSWAKQFIRFCRGSSLDIEPSDESIEVISRIFYFRDNSELLGTDRDSFSKFIQEIDEEDGKLEIFRFLTKKFPEQPQFWAHLGRFYSFVKKDTGKAIEAIDCALDREDNDSLIHHMKGMAIRQHVYNLILDDRPIDKNSSDARDNFYQNIIEEAEKASVCFARCRELSPTDEHGYISEVQMIIKVLSHSGTYHNNKPVDAVTYIDAPKWLRESLETSSYLLSQVRLIRQEEKQNRLESICQADLDNINENIEDALQKWDRLLIHGALSPQDKASVRRSIVYTRLKQVDHRWGDINDKNIGKVTKLLEENLQQGHNDRDLRLWLNAIRVLSEPPHLEEITEKIAHWRNNTSSIESIYYLYILQVLQALAGSQIDIGKAEANMKECQNRTRYRRKNDISFEWLGEGNGITQLINQENLGVWSNGFWTKKTMLKRIDGIISYIGGPAQGLIEIQETGMKAFFVPGKHFNKGSDENRKVTCYLGFSYSGLRAWGVEKNENHTATN